MGALRKPALWATGLAVALALTVGGRPTVNIGPYWVDNPDEEPALAADSGADPGRYPSASPSGLEEATAGAGGVALFEAVGGPSEEDEEGGGLRVFVHVVAPGENVTTIAAKYGIEKETILAANDLPNADRVYVGQKLTILSTDGAIHTVKQGESLWEIARLYRTDLDTIVATNAIANPNRLRPSQELIIPGLVAASIGSSIRSEQLVSADGKLLRAFSWPVRGRISSSYGPRWGRMHHGIDIAVNTGTEVKAAARGRVSFAGWNGGYGYLVVIDHGNGVETRYAHLSKILVHVGQYVTRGQVIAHSGNTGNSTGPHLHFEIRHRGNSVNPIQYLQ